MFSSEDDVADTTLMCFIIFGDKLIFGIVIDGIDLVSTGEDVFMVGI